MQNTEKTVQDIKVIFLDLSTKKIENLNSLFKFDNSVLAFKIDNQLYFFDPELLDDISSLKIEALYRTNTDLEFGNFDIDQGQLFILKNNELIYAGKDKSISIPYPQYVDFFNRLI